MSETTSETRGDSLKSELSAYSGGGRRRRGRGDVMARDTLVALETSALMRTIAGELPADASTRVRVSSSEDEGFDPAPLERRFKQLRALRAFRRAGYLARHYGGAQVWMVREGVTDYSKPARSSQRVVRLKVIGRFEIVADFGEGGEGSNGMVQDPESRSFGRPEFWRYTPSNVVSGGEDDLGSRVIHHSHLVMFVGEEVSDELIADYDYYGAPVAEMVLDGVESYESTVACGRELAKRAGQGVLTLDNFTELLEKNGRASLSEWLSAQDEALDVVGDLILGAGQSYARQPLQMSGWELIHDRQLQYLAALARMPITKLVGLPPSGMTSDDASARRNWAARVEDYQLDWLEPAYRTLVESDDSLEAPEGAWDLEFDPYDVPSPVEEADIVQKRSTVILSAYAAGLTGHEESRRMLARLDGLSLDADDEQTSDVDELLGGLDVVPLDAPAPSGAGSSGPGSEPSLEGTS